MSGATDTGLDMLIGTLQSRGRESRIRADIGPGYDQTTECARGLLSTMRRARIVDAAHDAKNIASVMLDARDEIRKLRALLDTCEQQARDDERGRVLSAWSAAEAERRLAIVTLACEGRSLDGRTTVMPVDRLLAALGIPGGER